jgi:hypothetical protein
MMEKYLLELFKDSNTVIIPGIGALTLTNKEKGEYMFMSFLKHDDGTLRKFIANHDSCEESVAKEKIEHFVNQINTDLNGGNSFELKNFGVFLKDKSGDIIFEPISSAAASQVAEDSSEVVLEQQIESTIDQPVSQIDLNEEISIEETVQVEAVVEEQPQVETNPIDDAEQSVVFNADEVIEEDKVETNAEEVKTVVIVEASDDAPEELISSSNIDESGSAEVVYSSEYSEQQQWEDDLDLPPINAKIERPKAPIIEKVKKDKKRRSPIFYILIVLVVVLVGGATTVGVFYNQIKTALFATEKSDTTKLAEGKQFEFSEEVESEEIPTESQKEDEQKEAPIVEPEVEEVVTPEPVNVPKQSVKGDFHLVVGSFQNEEFAKRFSEKMKSEGNDSEVIGPKNSFYLVTIGSYATEVDAKNSLTQKIAKYPKVWLLKNR